MIFSELKHDNSHHLVLCISLAPAHGLLSCASHSAPTFAGGPGRPLSPSCPPVLARVAVSVSATPYRPNRTTYLNPYWIHSVPPTAWPRVNLRFGHYVIPSWVPFAVAKDPPLPLPPRLHLNPIVSRPNPFRLFVFQLRSQPQPPLRHDYFPSCVRLPDCALAAVVGPAAGRTFARTSVLLCFLRYQHLAVGPTPSFAHMIMAAPCDCPSPQTRPHLGFLRPVHVPARPFLPFLPLFCRPMTGHLPATVAPRCRSVVP